MNQDYNVLFQFASQSFERLKVLNNLNAKNQDEKEFNEKYKEIYKSVILKIPPIILKNNRDFTYLYFFYGVTLNYLNKHTNNSELRENSIRLIKTAIENSPLQNAIEYEKELIEILYNEKKYTEASNYLFHLLQFYPKEKKYIKLLIDILQKTKRIDESLPFIHRLIDLDPYEYESRTNLGKMYLNQNKYKDALIMFQQSKEIEPKFPDNYKYIGKIYLIYNKKALAGSNFKTSISRKLYNNEQYENALKMSGKSTKKPDIRDNERNTLIFLFEMYVDLLKCDEDYKKELYEVEKKLRNKSYLLSTQIEIFKKKNKI